jgi:hypothetical protein
VEVRAKSVQKDLVCNYYPVRLVESIIHKKARSSVVQRRSDEKPLCILFVLVRFRVNVAEITLLKRTVPWIQD